MEASTSQPSTIIGAVGDVDLGTAFGHRLAAERRHGDPGVRGTEIGGEHDAGGRIEGEKRRSAAAGGSTLTGLD